MVAVNLALSLQRAGHRTVVFDMDFGMRTLDLYLGAENRALFDMGDVARGTCGIGKALIEFPEFSGLGLMPASQDVNDRDMSEESVLSVTEMIEKKKSVEYIIFDCSPGTSIVNTVCADIADYVLMVITPDYASLRDAEALEDRLIRKGIFERSYILNKILPDLVSKGCEPDYRRIDEMLKCEMMGMILFDDNIRASTNMGVPIVAKKDTYITANFDHIAQRLAGKLSTE